MGPTAVGKSALALELAQRFGGDIVTADSRQVYRYMDIGTAKPSSADRLAVRHYMLDLVEPSEGYSVARYRDEGGRVLDRIAEAGRVALVVGGTGFYIRALLDGLELPSVAPDPDLRRAYLAEADRLGPQALHDRLVASDPATAARIHPNNVPRVIRALEIVESLGAPVPAATTLRGRPALHLGLGMDRAKLHGIADRRIRQQIDAGLVEETRLLLEMGYDRTLPSLNGFGYREMIAYLDARCTLAQAVDDYATATHRYIRRQMTWFRADARIHWIDAGEPRPQAVNLIEQWLATGASDVPV